MSVDILPAALPADASAAFAGKVMRYVRALVGGYRGEAPADVEAEQALERASVARAGRVHAGLECLAEKVDAWRAQTGVVGAVGPAAGAQGGTVERRKRVLVLGSGMVAGPAVDELASRGDLDVVVGK